MTARVGIKSHRGMTLIELNVPHYSENTYLLPSKVKLSACHVCQDWMVRADALTQSQEETIWHLIKAKLIKYRSRRSDRGRPVCTECTGGR